MIKFFDWLLLDEPRVVVMKDNPFDGLSGTSSIKSSFGNMGILEKRGTSGMQLGIQKGTAGVDTFVDQLKAEGVTVQEESGRYVGSGIGDLRSEGKLDMMNDLASAIKKEE